jgi:small subunit ribosomal protein S1
MAQKNASQEEFDKLISDKNFSKIPKVGDLVSGKILGVTKKEVFIDIKGLTTGVVRGRELFSESDEYNKLVLGDNVEATVVALENENGEMELSFRYAGQQKAWKNLEDLKNSNEIVDAIVTDANKGGLMVRVSNLNGFLPVSQLSPEHYPRIQGGDKGKILEKLKKFVNEKFRVKVIDIDEKEEKIIVSEKTAWEETKKDVIDQYKVGNVVEGKIAAVTDFGVFIKFGEDENLEGLIHISELVWQRIDNPADLFEVGQTVKAEIINIQGSKIFLSIKKLMTDPWDKVAEKYKVGQIVKGKILKINHFGFFVELDQDIHGLAHTSEITAKENINPNDLAKIGDTLEFRIVSIEPKEHRLGLSLKLEADSSDKKEDKAPAKKAKKEKKEEAEEKEETKE